MVMMQGLSLNWAGAERSVSVAFVSDMEAKLQSRRDSTFQIHKGWGEGRSAPCVTSMVSQSGMRVFLDPEFSAVKLMAWIEEVL